MRVDCCVLKFSPIDGLELIPNIMAQHGMVDPAIFESLQDKVDQESATREVQHAFASRVVELADMEHRSSKRLCRRLKSKVSFKLLTSGSS